MPIVDIGTQRFTVVTYEDAPGYGGTPHQYLVSDVQPTLDVPPAQYARVTFQDGPVGEVGVNGCHHEDLLAIVIHRLQGFQSGDYACMETAKALTHLELALQALAARTVDRQARNVDGTSLV